MPTIDQPFEYIDDEDSLMRAIDEICEYKEVAMDLEHHSVRSFQGLTCLIQISTRDKDYVIDSIALRSSLHALSEFTTNPAIVKVLHGCESDVLWLQRDFGVYLVNCFDTFHAAKHLKYPALSLAHMIQYHCGITVDKKYQLADWRTRPLSDSMIAYAKNDTHFLLYIYDCLRRELWKNLGKDQGILSVLEASKRTCMKRYEKDPFWPLGYRKLLTGPRLAVPKAEDITEQQDAVVAALWNWRDKTARAADESVLFVMSNSELLRIGCLMPKDVSQLLSSGPISDMTRSYAADVIALINNELSVPVMIGSGWPAGHSKGASASVLVSPSDSLSHASAPLTGHSRESVSSNNSGSCLTGAAQSIALTHSRTSLKHT